MPQRLATIVFDDWKNAFNVISRKEGTLACLWITLLEVYCPQIFAQSDVHFGQDAAEEGVKVYLVEDVLLDGDVVFSPRMVADEVPNILHTAHRIFRFVLRGCEDLV